jgi:Na+/H+ antiporter NhaD/arsenite permease-like protein
MTDNATLTYLASLVPGLSDEFKVAIVAGAVTGGGLTIIANAPNPAGVAILKARFDEGVVNFGKLLLAALAPTAVAAMAFKLL